jgi:nickel-dependent lactate racemase
MSASLTTSVTGRGAADITLSPEELREIVHDVLSDVGPGARVLAIIPDKTRDDNTNHLVPLAARALAENGNGEFDILIAQGTHAPMSDHDKLAKIGAPEQAIPGLRQIHDHQWSVPDQLALIGELTANQASDLSGGLIDRAIPLRVNRLLKAGRYDTVLVFGATLPHEVAGFAGGAKYFFPGVAGPDLTHATHWLSALAGIDQVIGRIETPTRHLIEAAAEFIHQRVIMFSSVVSRVSDGRLVTRALFAGEIKQAFRRAAEISKLVHIRYTGRKYRRVVALLDQHLADMWVGGKASYRLGGIIEEGGDLLIYAPHLKTISETHGTMIERYGYAPLERVREMVASSPELRNNLCVAAHLAHVAYASRCDPTGGVAPRFNITLASAVPQETCRRVNLGFMDHRMFKLSEYESDPDTLIVERAGQELYLTSPE